MPDISQGSSLPWLPSHRLKSNLGSRSGDEDAREPGQNANSRLPQGGRRISRRASPFAEAGRGRAKQGCILLDGVSLLSTSYKVLLSVLLSSPFAQHEHLRSGRVSASRSHRGRDVSFVGMIGVFSVRLYPDHPLGDKKPAPRGRFVSEKLEATVGIEPTIGVLQTPALTTWPRRPCATGAEEGI